MTNQQPLYQQFDTASNMGFLNKQIPSHLLDNLNQKFQLRPYQEEAFARFFYYLNDYNNKKTPTHLLFNMATGSGKTLIMAGLILYLYEKGHRNFLFFVNTTNIIEKTKDNFLNKQSSKYLFREKITIDGKVININQVDNFEGVSNDNINICFTTIQKLHTDLHNERENSITYDDFKDKKIVLLSDESHHTQAKTKQRAISEAFEKPSWENTVEKIFTKNNSNLLLEFTATMDFLDKDIEEKYREKIIYRYDLKEFRNDGYSKDVNILQSAFDEKERMLQAIILNQYRQDVAGKYGINLKPIILFKAQKTIAQSKENQDKFNKLIDNLDATDIQTIRDKSEVDIIQKAFTLFQENKITDGLLVEKLKSNFAPNKCLNVNKDSDIENYQLTLNSLEDKNNQIRAIFAVQKLNEGWDVLNLFDIVRLYEGQNTGGSNKKIGKTTIAEAQLIGRGARYFPFTTNDNEEKYKRKFDKDIDNELRIIEELHYHSKNESRYISEIRRALIEEGMLDEQRFSLELTFKDDFKEKDIYKSGLIYLNKKTTNKNEKVKSFEDLGVKNKNIEYTIASGWGRTKAVYHEEDSKLESPPAITSREIKLLDIQLHIIQNALAKNTFYNFENLKKYFPHLTSNKEFITNKKYIAGLAINFKGSDKNLDNISNKDTLIAIIQLCKGIEQEIKENTTEYKGTEDFIPYKISDKFVDKTINVVKEPNPEYKSLADDNWYVFEKFYGTSEEKAFVEMMYGQKKEFEQKGYYDIYLIRNEQHVKIYNFADGRGFAPDFVLFMKDKEDNSLTYQIFIEPKGEHLQEHDGWKEEFLEDIYKKYKDNIITFNDSKKYRIIGVPFYNKDKENEFKKSFCDRIGIEDLSN